MAYTTILTCEGDSISGNSYRITIQSDVSATTPFTATLAVPIANLTYKPEVDDLAGALIPSVLDFYVERDPNDGTALDNFIDEIIEYQQDNAYLVLVEQDLGSGYQPYWRGILLQDELQQADSFTQTITFSAIDGLSYLKSKDYDPANTVTSSEPEYSPIKDVILNALQQGISTDFWGAGEEYLYTSVDWWEDSQSYSATGEPLETQVFDVRAFLKLTERGDGLFELDVQSCYDVLEAFARAYFCRVYMAGGAYRFEQIPLRENDSVKQNIYDKAGVRLSGGVKNVTVSLDQTRGAARLAGNTFQRFPALKLVEVVLKPYSSTFDNLITLDADDYSDTSTKGFGYFNQNIQNVIAIGNVSQSFILDFNFKCAALWQYEDANVVDNNNAVLGYIGMRPTCRVKVELSDINSSDVWYWDGQQWTLTVSTFRVNGGDISRLVDPTVDGTLSYKPSDSRTFSTATGNLPATGTLSVTLDDFKWRGWDTLTTVSDIALIGGGSYGIENPSGQVEMTFATKYDRGSTVRSMSLTNSDTKIADRLVYTYPEIRVSDGAVQTGCIMIDTVDGLASATAWRVANESTSLALGALLAQQRLELQRSVLEQYSGQVNCPNGYDIGLSFDGKIWIPSDYQFDFYNEYVNATWNKLGRESEGNTAGEQSPELGAFNSATLALMRAQSSFQVAGLPQAENVLMGIEYVKSENLMVETTPKLLSSGQRNNYEAITTEPSGSTLSTVTSTVHLFEWSGGGGTHIHAIPDADDMDGAMLEFITDDSFTGSETVEITPAAGTIKGASQFEITSPNTRYVFRAIRGNWY